MSHFSSVSSRSTTRRMSHGVPRRCWCGESIRTYVSKTEDNPYRRFYMCETGIQRKWEEHLFKWVDEALLDEIKMVDAKHNRLVEDVNDMKKNMAEYFKSSNDMLAKFEVEIKEKVEEKVKSELKVLKVSVLGFVGGAIARLLCKKLVS